MVTKGGTTVPVPAARHNLTDGEVVVHANDRRESVAGLGSGFAAPHRARRISQLLGERDRWDGVDLAAIQMDTLLGSWPTFNHLLDGVAATGAVEEVRQQLLAWDGRMDAASTTAALFAAWRTALVRLVAAHPLLTPLHGPTGLPALFDPWIDPTARVGAAIERVAAVGDDHGLRG